MADNTQRITIKMIAEKAGTSPGTVDRAINNRGGISEKSKQHILTIAEELGYKPNKFARALSTQKSLRIGMIYPVNPVIFYNQMELGIDNATKELRDYKITVDKIRFKSILSKDIKEELSQIEYKQYDAFAINSAGLISDKEIEDIISMGFPVITFNTDAPDSRRLFYIGNNSRLSGRMGGEMLSIFMHYRGNVTVLGNYASALQFSQRFAGFCEYIQPNCPNIHMYPCAEYYSDPERAKNALIDLLKQKPDINGVFSTSYSSTVGAIEALKTLNRKDIFLVGYDVAEDTAKGIEEGWCNALLYQDPVQQGYQAAHLLSKHLLEDWMPDKQHLHIETRIVLSSNLENYSVESLKKSSNIFQ